MNKASTFDLRNDRVRAHTDPAINQWIDEQTEHRIRLYAEQPPDLITQRIEQLDREWDIERILETNASSIILGSLILGTVASRKWFVLPFAVAGFLLQHAVQGWCPPVPFLRKRGVRTAGEIERERYALKILRGDFDSGGATNKPVAQRVVAMFRGNGGQAAMDGHGPGESAPRTKRPHSSGHGPGRRS